MLMPYDTTKSAPPLLPTFEESEEAHLNGTAPEQVEAEAPPPLRSLVDICPEGPDPKLTLLGDRFLCEAGSLLFIGPSGIGKSSAGAQQDIQWALGRPAFGIRPTRALRIITVQSENDDGDLREMYDGIRRGLRLTAHDEETLRGNLFYETHRTSTGADFLQFIDSLLGRQQFDLLRIDPFGVYLGGDVSDAALTTAFLSNELNPILAKHRVACVLNHHTPKTNNRDTSNWRGSDWMYAGAGSAYVTNWARAILVIDPTHAPHVFRFIAAKRGRRIGWLNEYGEQEAVRHFCHADDGIYWRDATDDDLQAVEDAAPGKAKRTDADLKALVPMTGAIPKKTLRERARGIGFAKNAIDPAMNRLLRNEDLYEWKIPRPKTNPEKLISRHEQTLLNGHK
jgi:hypothetical protein